VQLQLLTATVKLFLKRPHLAQDMVKRVLALVTHETDSPDLRDRGYMYWRLLSTVCLCTCVCVWLHVPASSLYGMSMYSRLLSTLCLSYLRVCMCVCICETAFPLYGMCVCVCVCVCI